jgi:Acyl-CoA carboxylase epsilon subunit
MTTTQAGHPGGQPVITVTRGLATQAEVAAIVAVLLSARTTAAPAAESARSSRWTEGFRTRAALPSPGPHSWRACARPR